MTRTRQRRPVAPDGVTVEGPSQPPEVGRPPDPSTAPQGWVLVCPICHAVIPPVDGLLFLVLAPRFAYHLWHRHPYEAQAFLVWLGHPPADWPVVE